MEEEREDGKEKRFVKKGQGLKNRLDEEEEREL